MNTNDLMIPGAVAGIVLVLGALLSMRRGQRRGVTRGVMIRMSRPDETVSNDITRTDRHRRTGREFLGWLYQLNLLQKLEENLWQAGIYARFADVLLVILMMFAAGRSARPGLSGDVKGSRPMGARNKNLPLIYI